MCHSFKKLSSLVFMSPGATPSPVTVSGNTVE